MYDENNPKNVLAYNLEPQFPTDTIYERNNIPWDYTKGELSIQITAPDGKTTDLGTAPFVGKQGQWLTTKNAKFTQWKPPMYGQYTVKATGWTQDIWGNKYEGGGTYKFWIAKRITLATATFQGQAYPVGNRYGRDIGFSPAVPADVEITATLFVNSDPKNPRTISYTGKASSGGMFTAAQGLKPLNFDAPGEYSALVLAKYTDPEGHLWVESMRHAGVVYPTDTPIVAHGKKVPVAGKLQDRGETNFEGYNTLSTGGEQKLDHINFPYNAGDVLLIAAEYQGANKIEPVLSWDYKTNPMGYDPNIQGIGLTNVKIQTSNGYSPHLFPEYITDWMYYYAAGARPGMMGRFLIADDGTRAPYWPTTNTNFGGQINASNNGDAPGDIYRLIGGVVVRKQNQAPLYAGYMSTAFIIPKGLEQQSRHRARRGRNDRLDRRKIAHLFGDERATGDCVRCGHDVRAGIPNRPDAAGEHEVHALLSRWSPGRCRRRRRCNWLVGWHRTLDARCAGVVSLHGGRRVERLQGTGAGDAKRGRADLRRRNKQTGERARHHVQLATADENRSGESNKIHRRKHRERNQLRDDHSRRGLGARRDSGDERQVRIHVRPCRAQQAGADVRCEEHVNWQSGTRRRGASHVLCERDSADDVPLVRAVDYSREHGELYKVGIGSHRPPAKLVA